MDHDSSAFGASSVPSSVPPLVPGLVLGRLLGRGAHGTVWEARDPVTGDRVAVKVGRRPDDARTTREAALLARVDHPHVVRLRNLVECPDGTRALVLELAGGGSLAGLVAARGRLGPGETVTVAVGLARTLADLHALGLVHGDLTPGNVLLADDGRPLVGDLGVAGVLGRADGERWGTTGFADPADGPADDPARDVHALGAVVRFCLTGSPDAGTGPAAGHPAGGTAGATADALLALADLCTGDRPDRRPDAAEVARLAWTAGPAEPLRLVAAGAAADAAPDDAGAARTRQARDQVTAALLGRSDAGPGATDVTRRVRDAARSAADRQAAAAEAGREHRRRRVRRAVRTGLVLGGAVGVGGLVAVLAATWLVDDRTGPAGPRSGPSGSQPSGSQPQGAQPPGARTAGPGLPGAGTSSGAGPSRPAPAAVARAVERLAAARAAAFGSASVAGLGTVDEAGSPALAADRALVDRLAARGLRLTGLRFTVSRVRVVRADGPTVTVTARVATSAHRQVGADGAVVARVPAGAARPVRLVLVETADGWRVRSVAPA
ncbi:serine/threonine-protein kinase [Kineosporia sp. A_224]|uniref:protein kinase domain-containing protein n=1 Tax=Kineosporia sp. A_224 TaxID=1962180 RepID=UPI0013046020|nr:serine/threonine-protein kinase [Kineosporia sp. A_224]